jgi:hypothetical protein
MAEPVPVPRRLRIDAPLPASGPGRWATVAALVVSGLVAALVVLMGAAVIWSVLAS